MSEQICSRCGAWETVCICIPGQTGVSSQGVMSNREVAETAASEIASTLTEIDFARARHRATNMHVKFLHGGGGDNALSSIAAIIATALNTRERETWAAAERSIVEAKEKVTLTGRQGKSQRNADRRASEERFIRGMDEAMGAIKDAAIRATVRDEGEKVK